ncbi:MAG: hypothetical protein WKF37_01440 [Bryobacteraceae bacterium]
MSKGLLSEVFLAKASSTFQRSSKLSECAAKDSSLLEMMTRDPLKVPVYTDKYWVTFPDRSGIYLARTLRLVREKKSKLANVSQLSKEEQLKLEDENVRKCLGVAL